MRSPERLLSYYRESATKCTHCCEEIATREVSLPRNVQVILMLLERGTAFTFNGSTLFKTMCTGGLSLTFKLASAVFMSGAINNLHYTTLSYNGSGAGGHCYDTLPNPKMRRGLIQHFTTGYFTRNTSLDHVLMDERYHNPEKCRLMVLEQISISSEAVPIFPLYKPEDKLIATDLVNMSSNDLREACSLRSIQYEHDLPREALLQLCIDWIRSGKEAKKSMNHGAAIFRQNISQ